MRKAPIRSFTVLTAAVLAAAHGAVQSTASLDDRRARAGAPVTWNAPAGPRGGTPLTGRLHGVALMRPST